MNSKTMKIISVLMVIMMVLSAFASVFAEDLLTPNSVKATSSDTSKNVGSVMNTVLGVIQVIAISIAVIMIVILAIKYVSAAPSEKADIKKSLTIYIIGAVLLFGATGILQLIKTFTNNSLGNK